MVPNRQFHILFITTERTIDTTKKLKLSSERGEKKNKRYLYKIYKKHILGQKAVSKKTVKSRKK